MNGSIVFSIETKQTPATTEQVQAVASLLKACGFRYKVAVGCYMGEVKQSLVVEWTTAAFKLAQGLAEGFNQETMMLVESNGDSRLLIISGPNAGDIVRLGTIHAVREKTALASENWTAVGGKFYTTVK